MKATLACPKCHGRRVWQIEKLGAADQGAHDRPLRLACQRRRRTQTEGVLQRFLHGTQQTYDAGFLDAWVCATCGYTELWSHDLEGLEHDPDQGIRLHEASTQQGQ